MPYGKSRNIIIVGSDAMTAGPNLTSGAAPPCRACRPAPGSSQVFPPAAGTPHTPDT